MFNPGEVRNDFPIFQREINGKRLAYLDSGATSQKPKQVLAAVTGYYEKHNGAAHRGAHTLGDEATEMLARARERVARFIKAGRSEEVIWVRNTTEAINLVAYSWGEENVGQGERVVVTEMEHHANIVPWQRLAKKVGGKCEFVKVGEEGEIDLEDYKQKVRGANLVAFVHVSNALGTVNPVKEMVAIAKKAGATVLVDGAQAVPHMKVDVCEIGCDFYVFSGHKMLGPGGSGVLWGRKELLEKMEPFLAGGGMISEVSKESASWAELPDKFEAGVPDVASPVGLEAAVAYLEKLGMDEVREHDKRVVEYALRRLGEIEGVTLLGPKDAERRSGSVSFVYEGVHAHDLATVLDGQGVAIRSGHHCTMVLHKAMGVAASARASFNVYTMEEDIDQLVTAIEEVKRVFGE